MRGPVRQRGGGCAPNQKRADDVLLQPRPGSTTRPGAAPRHPRPLWAPSPALTGVEQMFITEAPAQGRGCLRSNPGHAPIEGEGVSEAAFLRPGLAARVSASRRKRCSWGGGTQDHARQPARRSARPPAAPLPLPLTHLPRAARSQLECGRRPILPPRAHTHLPHGRARADHAPGPGAPRSLARSHARMHAHAGPAPRRVGPHATCSPQL